MAAVAPCADGGGRAAGGGCVVALWLGMANRHKGNFEAQSWEPESPGSRGPTGHAPQADINGSVVGGGYFRGRESGLGRCVLVVENRFVTSQNTVWGWLSGSATEIPDRRRESGSLSEAEGAANGAGAGDAGRAAEEAAAAAEGHRGGQPKPGTTLRRAAGRRTWAQCSICWRRTLRRWRDGFGGSMTRRNQGWRSATALPTPPD